MYPDKYSIGKQIRKLRLSKDMSGLELALRADINRTYMHGIEMGQNNISIQKLSQICAVFGITLSSFFQSLET